MQALEQRLEQNPDLAFLGCAAAAHYLLGWEIRESWLAGIAMSTTSVAVVYAVMLEFGFNVTDYGKTVLAACFITDLGTVVALGLLFAPFTFKTVIFLGAGLAAFLVLPRLTPGFFRRYGGRPSELEAKYLLFSLFGMAALATWAESEAVLPTYLLGMVLAGTVGKDHVLIRSHLVLDYNGTLAVDGELLPGVRQRLKALSGSLRIHVVTADTFGKAKEGVSGVDCELSILTQENQDCAKQAYVERLVASEVVAIGNGRNDRLMLQAAVLGIAVLQREGAAAEAITAADIVTNNVLDALDLLTHPLRLIASLRA